MYVPSYDFRLFDIGAFSPLQAQEFGAATTFNANDPTSFIDFSLNQLIGLTQPRNTRPFPQTQIPAEKELFDFLRFFQSKDKVEVYPSGTLPPELQRKGSTTQSAGVIKKCDENSSWLDRMRGSIGIGGCCPYQVIDNQCVLVSDDSSVGTVSPSGKRITLGDLFKDLPAGAGTFLIAVVVIILLLLFVKR